MYDKCGAYDYYSQAIDSNRGWSTDCRNPMKGRPCWLPTWLNLYRLFRNRRQSECQRRRRRRNMNEFVLYPSLTTKRKTKTPPRAQKLFNRIGFVIINDGANNKDAAAGVVVAAGDGCRNGRRCQSNVPCDMYQGTTTDDAIYVIAGATRTSNDDDKCIEKHEKHENHERAIWLLCNWCMKEQYDCYTINTLKEQYDC